MQGCTFGPSSSPHLLMTCGDCKVKVWNTVTCVEVWGSTFEGDELTRVEWPSPGIVHLVGESGDHRAIQCLHL